MPKKLHLKLEELSEEESDSGVEDDDGIVFEAPPAKEKPVKEKPVKKPTKKVTIKEEPVEKENIPTSNEEYLIWCAKCRKKTNNKEIVEVEVKGKSDGKKRTSIKTTCSDCGTNKTSFKSKPK